MSHDNELGVAILKALGLPEYVERMEIIFSGNQPPRVRCEFWLWQQGMKHEDMVKKFAEYELVRRAPSDAHPATPAPDHENQQEAA